jgi:hypothetical protein
VSFERGSKLTRIDGWAFSLCRSLRSFVIPAQVEIIGLRAFRGCKSLCELIFDLPSRLEQLDLPPSKFGSLSIPDSVEIVQGGIGKQDGQRRLLQFGRESRLVTIELMHCVEPLIPRRGYTESDLFVRLSEEVLRRFRSQFEYL